MPVANRATLSLPKSLDLHLEISRALSLYKQLFRVPTQAQAACQTLLAVLHPAEEERHSYDIHCPFCRVRPKGIA